MQLQLYRDPVINANFAQNLCQATSSFIQHSFIDETTKINSEKISQEAALNVLTQPDLDKLAYHIRDKVSPRQNRLAAEQNDILAKNVFSKLNQEEFMRMDCQTIKKLHRQVMLLVHPDKPTLSDNSIAHQAAVNLNNAREALNC